MAKYRLLLRAAAERGILALPFPLRRQVNHKACSLKSDPRQDGHQSLGKPGWFRLRVHGWSILYKIDDERRLVTIAVVVQSGASIY